MDTIRMLSVSPNPIVRSSLEDMLEALQRRDESELPRDIPPALPRRTTSRSRPPSAKRRLPVTSEAHATGESSGFCIGNGETPGQNKIVDPEDFKQEVQQCTPVEVPKDVHDCQHLPELDRVVVTFQSYVRGEIARKDYSALLRLKKQDICEKKLDHQEVLPSVVEELQQKILMAEATLELREKENESLREQMEQHKARWSEFEARIKSNEETWQKQIASLQMDLARAQKSGAAECIIDRPKNSEGSKSDVSCEDEWREVVEAENSRYASFSFKKFRGLKRAFKAWTKDYKFRVSDSCAKIHSVAHNEARNRHWKTWWGKKSKRHY